MRTVLLSALLTATAFGQRSGTAQSHPAMAPPPAPRIHANPPAAPRPTAPPPVAARPPYNPPRPYQPHQPRTIVVPYPVFVGGGYGYGPAAYDSAPAPVGIVNPDYRQDVVNPIIVDYSNIPLPEPVDADGNIMRDDEPTIFLIALTDHNVVAAIAYWVDGDTLNWVTRDAKQNHMSLSLVDREFSKQLNDERHVEFKLPPAK